MKFVLEIKTNNDAMQTGADIADRLRAIANLIEGQGSGLVASGIIRDINGNRVGTWSAG